MTDIDNARAILDEARENMRMSATPACRRSPIAAETVATPALPALPALPAPRTKMEPQSQVNVDFTGIPPFTAQMLSTHTGVSLRAIREAIRGEQIRTTRHEKGPRLLDIADTARWLQAKHRVMPVALLDIAVQGES